MKRKVALYVRCSTNSQTTDSQRRELEIYCGRQDWDVVRVYDDSGFSGKNDNRPALKELLADSLKGRFSVVVCYKIDRLARSTIHLLQILNELRSVGVDFCATTQAIDTTNSAGRMLMVFLAAIAEFERETIVERVKTGLERAKANGVKLGRPKLLFDYRKGLELKRQGKTWSDISKALNVSRATLRRMITPLLKIPLV
jgi:DNA invertase Pin-like site-specific DNA recombinase